MNSFINTFIRALIRNIANTTARKVGFIGVVVLTVILVLVQQARADTLFTYGDQSPGTVDNGYGLNAPTANGCWYKQDVEEFGIYWGSAASDLGLTTQSACSSYAWSSSGYLGARFNGVPATTTTIPTTTTTTLPVTTTTSTTTTVPTTTTIPTTTTVLATTTTTCSTGNYSEEQLCQINKETSSTRAESLLGFSLIIFLMAINIGMRVWR